MKIEFELEELLNFVKTLEMKKQNKEQNFIKTLQEQQNYKLRNSINYKMNHYDPNPYAMNGYSKKDSSNDWGILN